MKKSIKRMIICMNCFVVLLLSACSSVSSSTYFNDSKIKISFTNSEPKDFYSEKTICFNHDMEKAELEGKLKMDGGEVKIDVIDSTSDECVWSGEYTKDSKFTIEIKDIKAYDEYFLQVQATKSKMAVIKISSDVQLDEDTEKPEKED